MWGKGECEGRKYERNRKWGKRECEGRKHERNRKLKSSVLLIAKELLKAGIELNTDFGFVKQKLLNQMRAFSLTCLLYMYVSLNI